MVSWNYNFDATAGCNFLGKTRNLKMHWIEKSEKPSSLLTKTENLRLSWTKTTNLVRHQNQKTAVFKCENRKTEPKLARSAKPKIPTPPIRTRLSRVQSTFFPEESPRKGRRLLSWTPASNRVGNQSHEMPTLEAILVQLQTASVLLSEFKVCFFSFPKTEADKLGH